MPVGVATCRVLVFTMSSAHLCVKATQEFKPLSCQELLVRDARKKFTLDDLALLRRRPRQQPRRSDRMYRPWSWELPGARFWPWLTIERYIGEELRLRHDRKMPHRQPLWPPDDLVRARPTVFAIEPRYKPLCVAPVRETCTAERPLVCAPATCKPYVNFVNWQWLPHSLSAVSYKAHNP